MRTLVAIAKRPARLLLTLRPLLVSFRFYPYPHFTSGYQVKGKFRLHDVTGIQQIESWVIPVYCSSLSDEISDIKRNS